MSTTSTEPVAVGLARERRGRRLRRAGLAAFGAFVLAGLVGALGVRTTTDEARDGGLEVRLTRAVVARPALAVPYRLVVSRPGGFDDPVEVRVSTSYLEALDENGASPDPDSATTDGDETVWTFDPPEGEVLTVWLDTRIEPGVQWRRGGRTTVVNGGDRVVIDHPVWILP
ncbi:MAG: hypothetical protein AB7L84_12140 [Acidimicrobiia bacterium]